MRERLPIALFLVLLFAYFSKGNAQTSVLRMHNPAATSGSAPAGYSDYIARFELDTPGILKEIHIWLNGNSGASATVTMYNHEGGTSFPQLEKPLFAPVTITKTITGKEELVVKMDSGIRSANSQFFVCIQNLKNGALPAMENGAPKTSCSSGSGGDYYYTFYKNSSGQWFLGTKKAFWIDCYFQYDKNPFLFHFQNVNSKLGIPDNLSANSIAWCDIDGNGYPDLLTGSRLFLNTAFTDSGIGRRLTEITDAGLSGSPRASTFVDFNNDGRMDIFFLGDGTKSAVYIQTDRMKFTRMDIANIPDLPALNCYSFGDVDGDNFPDLFIGQLWGAYPIPYPNYLFKNNGGNTMTDITKKLYPDYDGKDNYPAGSACDAGNSATWLSGGNKNRRSRASRFVDFDNDGDLDLFVVNYFLESDEFYRNNGDGTFTEICGSKGIDKNNTGTGNHGTGVDFGDMDNDGDMDLLLCQFAHPAFAKQYDHRNTTIYKNSGSPAFNFDDTYTKNGIEFEETYAGGTLADINNDGLQDIIETVYYGCRWPKLYLQKTDGTFSLQRDPVLEPMVTAQDAVWTDFDMDGRMDLCIPDNGQLRILKNNLESAGNWIGFIPPVSYGNMDRSRLKIYSNGKTYVRDMAIGRGQMMRSAEIFHVGIGNQKVDSMVFEYVNQYGTHPFVFHHPELNKYHQLKEGYRIDSEAPQAWPNPARDHINLRLPQNVDIHFRIVNASGKIVLEEKINTNAGYNWYNLRLESFSSGVYFYQYQTGKTNYHGKFVVTK